MDTVYWVCFLVGGFFVLLSMIGGDAEADADVDFDADVEADFDADVETDLDADLGEGGPDFVDLFSVRALFLFLAFFGLTGVLLSWAGTDEPLTTLLAGLTGLAVGLGGNYMIKRVGYAHVSSNVTSMELKGQTAHVLVPFEGTSKGKIHLVSRALLHHGAGVAGRERQRFFHQNRAQRSVTLQQALHHFRM